MDLRVKLLTKDVFTFSIMHYYKTFMGVISVITTALVIGIVAVSWSGQSGPYRVILLLGAIVVVCMQPFMLYRKSRRQVLDPQLGKEIFYKMDYNGIRVQQGGEKAVIGWRQVAKVRRIPGMYVIYLNKSSAYLFPDWALTGGKKGQFLKMIDQYVDSSKRRGI